MKAAKQLCYITAYVALILAVAFCTSLTVKALSLDANTAVLNSDTQINLSWTSVANAVYYNISRDTYVISSINVDSTRNYLSFEDTELIPQTSYNYTVTAVNPSGKAIGAASQTVTTTQMKSPSFANAHLDINNNVVTLTWVNNSLAVKGTSIYNAEGEQIASTYTDSNTVTFIDPSLESGDSARYFLMSRDNKGHSSSLSEEITVTNLDIPEIQAVIENGTTSITWDKTSDIVYFSLERSKYLNDSWGLWDVIKTKIDEDTVKIKDKPSEQATYRYRLAVDNEKHKGYSNISKPVTKLSAPSNLKCVPVSPGRIDLSWTNPKAGDFRLNIERKGESGGYILLDTVDRNISSYSDAEGILLNHTYSYRVTAFDPDDNTASTASYQIKTVPPSPARELTLDITKPTKITINWEDDSDNESGFIIERKINSQDFLEIGRTLANVTSFSDGSVNSQDRYTYRVISFNPFGNAKSYSNEVSCSTSSIKDPPATLTATPISDTQVDLSWEYDNYAAYRTLIERKSEENEPWKVLAELEAGFSSYTDKKLSQNKQYYYRVKNVLGNNIFSAPYPKEEPGKSVLTKLKAPSELKAVWYTPGLVYLTWLDSYPEDCELVIERKAGNGEYSVIKTLDSDSTSWFNSNLNPDITYTYRIKAVTQDNSSSYSNEANAEELNINAPYNLKYSVTSLTELTLSWEDKSNMETGYKIERKTGLTGTWSEIASIGANSTSYKVKGLNSGTTYFFRVKAYSTSNNLEYSSSEIEVFMKLPPPPSDLKVNISSPSHVVLQWKDNSVDEEGFIIERKSVKDDFIEIARVGRNIQAYTDISTAAGSVYFYRVKAFNSVAGTDYTNMVSIETSPANSFNDLSGVPWAKTAIEDLAAKGIIKGRSEEMGIFAPNDKITRAEFISLVIKVFGIDRTPVGTFKDVLPNHWFYKSVMTAKNMGIVSGTGDNNFNPNEPIRREDIAVIIVKSFKAVDNPLPYYSDSILNGFSDKKLISSYTLSSLASLNGEKIINGKSSTQIAPGEFATRAEAAVMLYKVLKKLE